MIPETLRGGRHGRVILPIAVFLGPPARIEVVQENILPVHFLRGVVARVIGRGVTQVIGAVRLISGFHEIEERVVDECLSQVALKIEQRHVEKVHRLVEARLRLLFLPQVGARGEIRPSRCHVQSLKSSPRYSCRASGSFTRWSASPCTRILPSNRRYARSVIDSVSRTLWSVMRTPRPLSLKPRTMR